MASSMEGIERLARRYTDAWNSGSPEAVSGFYSESGSIVINRGSAFEGRARVAEMARGFFSDIPDLNLVCDGIRWAGNHAVYQWTFTGTHARTNRRVRVSGWEEWDLDEDCLITSSRGWFDAAGYEEQTGAHHA